MTEDHIQKRLNDLTGNDRLKQRQAYAFIKQSGDLRFVDGLIDNLITDNESLQRDCILLLGYLGSDEATPLLIHMLDNPRIETLHRDIILSLGRIGDDDAIDVLIDFLNTYVDHLLREDVIIALGYTQHHRAETALLLLHTSDNPYVRQKLADALSNFTSEATLKTLIKLLDDTDRRVRINAAKSLGEIGAIVAIPALDNALEDPEWSVRKQAVKALVQFNDDRVIEPLCFALEDSHYPIRIIAAEKLGNIGTPLAYEPLLKARSIYRNSAFDRAIAKLTGHQVRRADVDTKFLIDMLPVHPQPDGIAKTLEAIGTPEALEAVQRWRKQHGDE